MAAGNVSMDYELVAKHIAGANEAIDRTRGHINQALSNVENTVGSQWQGPSSGAAMQSMTDIHQKGHKALNLLDDLQQKLNSGSKNLASQEEQGKQSLGRLTTL